MIRVSDSIDSDNAYIILPGLGSGCSQNLSVKELYQVKSCYSWQVKGNHKMVSICIQEENINPQLKTVCISPLL